MCICIVQLGRGDIAGVQDRMDALFTFPNVPSAISPTTVYSPSLYAGYFCGGSSVIVGCQWCKQDQGESEEKLKNAREARALCRNASQRYHRLSAICGHVLGLVWPRWRPNLTLNHDGPEDRRGSRRPSDFLWPPWSAGKSDRDSISHKKS